MSSVIRNQKIAGNYRVKEPINNFKLRVKIVQQRPLLAELLENDGDTRDSNFLEEEDRTFEWQEKVLSQFEVTFYSEDKNCLTEQQKEYHRRIKEDDAQGYQLYSYTQSDSYCADNQLLTRAFRNKLSIRNQTALPTFQNRKPFAERYNKTVVDDEPNEARIRSNHYVYTERKTMYVMVDLSRRDKTFPGSDDDLETLLCTATYDRHRRILSVDPDFTTDRSHYTLVNSNGIRFNYWIEHASEKQSSFELQQQRNDSRRETRERRVQKDAEMSHRLQLTPPNSQRIFLKLDILSIHDFCFDGLFVTYYIDLPERWSTSQKERLFGRTQRCNLKKKSAYFSYATDISLDFQLNNLSDKKEASPLWPRLLLSVASLDSWTRYRTEGYATVPLPFEPGLYEFDVPTWRAAGSIVNSLRRFFTGGTYELDDISYCGIPVGHEGTILNKSNLKVILSGHVKVRMNIVHQKQASRDGSLQLDYTERSSTDALMNNIENIFEQFKAARERMIQIRSFNPH